MEGVSLLPSVVLTKEIIMRKVKLVVQECYAGKRKSEEAFAAVFLSNAAALTESTKPSIIELTDRSQDSLCSGKGADDGTSEE